jgi:hypothetical protein
VIVDAALTSVPSFESALRQQATRVAAFHHDAFARVRGIENDGSVATLVVVSDHVRGVRLSTLLGRFLESSRIERIMMPAGRHELDIVNEALGYEEHPTVQVTAGQTVALNLTWPTGVLSINAVPWAQAFVDGTAVGETPIANLQVPIGLHEIVFRHPQLGEHRASVTVTARETAKLGIDLRAK